MSEFCACKSGLYPRVCAKSKPSESHHCISAFHKRFRMYVAMSLIWGCAGRWYCPVVVNLNSMISFTHSPSNHYATSPVTLSCRVLQYRVIRIVSWSHSGRIVALCLSSNHRWSLDIDSAHNSDIYK